RGDRREAFPNFRPGLNGYADRRSVIEVKTEKGVPNGSLRPVGQIEIQRGQMRDRNLALFVAYGEIIPPPLFEIADAGDAHAVAVDERSRHHRHFRPPGTVMRRLDATEPNNHA